MFENGYLHKIGVNPDMTIDQLVNQIKQDYKIQNLRLIKKQSVWDEIDLTSKQYQMLTLFKAGIQDSETLDVMKVQSLSELKIHILTGPKPIGLDYKCYLQKTTIQDLKSEVEKELLPSPEIATVDIYINKKLYNQFDELKIKLIDLSVSDSSQIVAKMRYNGYDSY